ncbi:MAG: UDP-3-O-acyl-N-acetylglucosamine deacetylase, partial [Planctomycetota bacterium]
MAETDHNPDATAAATRTKQHTLAGPVTVSGKGLLLGEDATITIHPAPPDHGIVFERTDVSPPVQIPALVQNIASRARRTTLALSNTSIETIEHCMSALAGLCIDNVLIKVAGPEMPCGDGSAAPFADPIAEV